MLASYVGASVSCCTVSMCCVSVIFSVLWQVIKSLLKFTVVTGVGSVSSMVFSSHVLLWFPLCVSHLLNGQFSDTLLCICFPCFISMHRAQQWVTSLSSPLMTILCPEGNAHPAVVLYILQYHSPLFFLIVPSCFSVLIMALIAGRSSIIVSSSWSGSSHPISWASMLEIIAA